MVSGHDLGRAAANLMMKRQKHATAELAPFQAIVSSISGGFVYIQEEGPDETPWTQAIRFTAGLKLMPGCRVQIQPTRGGGYLCIGCIDDTDTWEVGMLEAYEATQSASDTPSSTSTSLFDTITLTVGTPMAGVYRVRVIHMIGVAHSTSGSVKIAVQVNGSDSTGNTLSAPTLAVPTNTLQTSERYSSISLDGSTPIVVKGRLAAVSAGTVTSRNPILDVTVRRIS